MIGSSVSVKARKNRSIVMAFKFLNVARQVVLFRSRVSSISIFKSISVMTTQHTKNL